MDPSDAYYNSDEGRGVWERCSLLHDQCDLSMRGTLVLVGRHDWVAPVMVHSSSRPLLEPGGSSLQALNPGQRRWKRLYLLRATRSHTARLATKIRRI